MSVENTMKVKVLADGTAVEVLPDGSTRPMPPDGTDWEAVGRLTEEEIQAAARTDPDNLPREDYPPDQWKRMPPVRQIRRACRLTQEQFADRFHIPLGTLRDWEQGKSEPDAAARAYLHVIAVDPDAVAHAFEVRRLAAE
jgi:putative transcriptional regulator